MLLKFVSKVTQHVLPERHWIRKIPEMRQRRAKVENTIRSYQEMSEKLREEVDKNHFSRYLVYESCTKEEEVNTHDVLLTSSLSE